MCVKAGRTECLRSASTGEKSCNIRQKKWHEIYVFGKMGGADEGQVVRLLGVGLGEGFIE